MKNSTSAYFKRKQKNFMKNNKVILATLAALTAQVIFGFSFMFTGIALENASPMTVIADRYIVAFLGLSLVMLFTKTKLRIEKNIWKLVLMSLFQPLMYFVFETYGVERTNSSFSGVMISMIPIVSMIAGIFVLNERPSFMQYVFAALSVAGVVIAVLSGQKEGIVSGLGVILLIGAVLSSAFYNISSRKISSEFSAFERTYAMTLIGVVSFVLIAFFENRQNPVNIIAGFSESSYLYAILYLGIVSSVAAFLLLNFANTHLPVAKTTVFSNITTVVSVIAGVVFLDEQITALVILGVTMIVTGVVGVQALNTKQ